MYNLRKCIHEQISAFLRPVPRGFQLSPGDGIPGGEEDGP